MISNILIGLVVSLVLSQRFQNPASNLYILDYPGNRSLHTHPIPRSGGVAILIGIVIGEFATCLHYQCPNGLIWLLSSALPTSLVSYLDDRHGLNPLVRIVAHLFTAISLLIVLGYHTPQIELLGIDWLLPQPLIMMLTLLFIIWMINLYNFMDGMDGLASGMAVIGFTSLAIMGAQSGDDGFVAASLVIASASAGFLWFNLPPARIFMGDTGAATLGYLAAAFSLWGNQQGLFPLWLAGLVFSPFIVDATVTLGRRLSHGEKPWQPHKTHYYQRLVQIGWGHRKTLLAEYALMLACSASALGSLHLPPRWQYGLVIVWLLVYIMLMAGVQRLERTAAYRETLDD